MKEKPDYLSQEELDKLIAEVESGDMASPPPDMLNEILIRAVKQGDGGTDRAKTMEEEKSGRERKFKSYCIRVITSAAAAILLIFMAPAFFSSHGTLSGENGKIWGGDRTTKEVAAESSFIAELGSTHYLNGGSHHIFK